MINAVCCRRLRVHRRRRGGRARRRRRLQQLQARRGHRLQVPVPTRQAGRMVRAALEPAAGGVRGPPPEAPEGGVPALRAGAAVAAGERPARPAVAEVWVHAGQVAPRRRVDAARRGPGGVVGGGVDGEGAARRGPEARRGRPLDGAVRLRLRRPALRGRSTAAKAKLRAPKWA